MAKEKQTAAVIRQECIATDIYSMWIETSIADVSHPGQFISVYPKDRSKLLPRPISICETAPGRLRIVYRIAGSGTAEFAGYKSGDPIEILGPLGNGFPLDGRDALLIGGGIGIPPMLSLAKALPGKKTVVAGYKSELFLTEDFAGHADLLIATEDGSSGTKGTVLNAIRENHLTGSVIYACGPMPMLKAVKEYAIEQGIPAWISLEERMACGVGACLGCVVKTTGKDEHSNVNNARICKDGPVFDAKEVDLT